MSRRTFLTDATGVYNPCVPVPSFRSLVEPAARTSGGCCGPTNGGR